MCATATIIKLNEAVFTTHHRLMIVSHPHTKALISSSLKKYKQVHYFHSAPEAIHSLKTIKPSLVISEIDLPNGNAWKLINAIRTGKLCPSNTPTVLLTHGEKTLSLERMARIRRSSLYTDKSFDNIPEFIKNLLKNPTALPRILLIEDDETVAEYLVSILSKSFSIEVAYNGDSGLALWKENRHDLVVLDLELPTIHGIDVLEHIRATDINQPVLVLSGFLDDENVTKISLEDATFSADKELLGMPHILMRRCLETLEWRNLNAMRENEQRQHEKSELISEAEDWLTFSDFESLVKVPTSVYTARALLWKAKILDKDRT